MKRNLEQNFKDAFEQFELPYNPEAWNALNKKLDAQQAVSDMTPKKGNGWKWFMGASLFIGAIATILFFQKQTSPHPSKQDALASSTSDERVVNESKTDKVQLVEQQRMKDKKNIQTSVVTEQSHKNEVMLSPATEKEASSVLKNTSGVQHTTSTEPQANLIEQEMIHLEELTNNDFNFPVLASMLCQNTTKNIENSNKTDLLLLDPKGNRTIIKAATSKKITFNLAGDYLLQSLSNPSLKTTFTVREAAHADFQIVDELVYENGIPTTTVAALEPSAKYQWKVNGVLSKQTNSEMTNHFYKRGTYSIELIQTDQFGCKSSVSKDVRIEESYNLLAPNGFMPLSSDTRKNKFIPFALTVRNTEFKLFIIEPRSGNVIFETNSIEGWDGTDPISKQLVPENNAYIWKVLLTNPEQGEPREYSGIVTRF